MDFLHFVPLTWFVILLIRLDSDSNLFRQESNQLVNLHDSHLGYKTSLSIVVVDLKALLRDTSI